VAKLAQEPLYSRRKGTRVQPDHIYVIPPGKIMTISDRRLSLEEQPKHPSVSHSIYIFFRSLAEDVKERAIAIVLSGAGSDGADGARAIKAQQGLVIVQDPETAKYDSVPLLTPQPRRRLCPRNMREEFREPGSEKPLPAFPQEPKRKGPR